VGKKFINFVTNPVIIFIILILPILAFIIFNLLWNDSFLLSSFFEAYIIYFGTVFLALISLYQNKNLIKHNAKLEKEMDYQRDLDNIKYLPFVNCHPSLLLQAETEPDTFHIINLHKMSDINCVDDVNIYIEMSIENISAYRIQSLSCIAKRNNKIVGEGTTILNFMLDPQELTYITIFCSCLEGNPDITRLDPNENTLIFSCLSYNEETYKYLVDDEVEIIFTLSNVLGFEHKAIIKFTDLGGDGFFDSKYKTEEEIIAFGNFTASRFQPYFEMENLNIRKYPNIVEKGKN